MMKQTRIAVSTVALAVLLAGCGQSKQFFGLEQDAPDEFAVVTRAPLVIPPDYGLRTPAPGTQRPQEKTVQDAAKTILLRSGGSNGAGGAGGDTSRGETALLNRAGTGSADPNIRAKVDRESAAIAQGDDGLIDSLIFWQEKPEPGTVVNAEEEARRIRENAALGDAATKGKTPIIERRERGFLEGLF